MELDFLQISNETYNFLKRIAAYSFLSISNFFFFCSFFCKQTKVFQCEPNWKLLPSTFISPFGLKPLAHLPEIVVDADFYKLFGFCPCLQHIMIAFPLGSRSMSVTHFQVVLSHLQKIYHPIFYTSLSFCSFFTVGLLIGENPGTFKLACLLCFTSR